MSDMKKPWIILIAILIVIGGIWFFRDGEMADDNTTPTTTSTNTAGTNVMSIEDYVKENIVGLSNEAGTPEVLGGKFYVTKLEANGGTVVVNYEDGHNAYVADFTYSTDAKGVITPKTFKIRK